MSSTAVRLTWDGVTMIYIKLSTQKLSYQEHYPDPVLPKSYLSMYCEGLELAIVQLYDLGHA